MNQLTLIDEPGILPNGQTIKIGDVVMAEYYMYVTITKVFEKDGKLSIIGPAAYCFEVSIDQLINSNNVDVKKMTPKDVYIFCKKNQWNTKKYLSLFK